MFDKLTAVETRYDELMTRLGTAEVQSDPAEYRKSAKALAEIEPLVQKFREYKNVAQDIAGARELAATGGDFARSAHERESLHARDPPAIFQ